MGGSPGPEGPRPPGRIHAGLNLGGAAGITSGHTLDGAPGEPGSRLQVIMTAIGYQST